MKIRTQTTKRVFVCLATLVSLLVAGRAAGQQSDVGGVQQAAFTRPASGSGDQKVSFTQQPATVGDIIEQNIDLELRMMMSMRKGNEVAGKQLTTVRTDQRRILTATEVDNGRMVSVKVHYPVATKQETVVEANQSPTEPLAGAQPVQGKTYICQRLAGADGELVVTDEAGNRPPTEEYVMVAQQMQMVGRPNLLADFLAGRTVAVGEKIKLPADVARLVFNNLGDRFGKVTRFTLTLQNVKSEHGVAYAVFQANVDASANSSTQMRLEVEGPLVIDVATCRAQKIELIGPIGMSETRGSYSTAYQLIGTGRLQMGIASTFRDSPR